MASNTLSLIRVPLTRVFALASSAADALLRVAGILYVAPCASFGSTESYDKTPVKGVDDNIQRSTSWSLAGR